MTIPNEDKLIQRVREEVWRWGEGGINEKSYIEAIREALQEAYESGCQNTVRAVSRQRRIAGYGDV